MNTEQRVEYVLEQGGGLYRRTVMPDVPIIVPDSLQAQFSASATIKVKNLLTIAEWGAVNGYLGMNSYSHWTIPVKRIIFRCPFKPVEKVFVPLFDSRDTAMEVTWVVPDGMRVVLLLAARCQGSPAKWQVDKMYLYAADNRPEYWRLPLPNVFDDGSICEGRAIRIFPTLTEAIVDALTTFDHSRWNADLWSDVEKTHNMFRFVADGDKMNTATINAQSWILLCRKVVVDVQKYIVL